MSTYTCLKRIFSCRRKKHNYVKEKQDEMENPFTEASEEKKDESTVLILEPGDDENPFASTIKSVPISVLEDQRSSLPLFRFKPDFSGVESGPMADDATTRNGLSMQIKNTLKSGWSFFSESRDDSSEEMWDGKAVFASARGEQFNEESSMFEEENEEKTSYSSLSELGADRSRSERNDWAFGSSLVADRITAFLKRNF